MQSQCVPALTGASWLLPSHRPAEACLSKPQFWEEEEGPSQGAVQTLAGLVGHSEVMLDNNLFC
jgi:hypothetical protein